MRATDRQPGLNTVTNGSLTAYSSINLIPKLRLEGGLRSPATLDALASAGLKLVPDPDGQCSGEYYGVLKAAIRADKAPLN